MLDHPQASPDRAGAQPPLRAVLLNGALRGDESLAPVERELLDLLRGSGAEVRSYPLRDIPLAYCQGCFECWTRSPGLCKTDGDAGREIAGALIDSDLLVLLTPITFGGYSSEIKKVLDRSICLVLPFFRRVNGEVHHQPRYSRFPAVAAVGVLAEPDPEQERIFRTVVERNAVNMDCRAHSVSVLASGAETVEVRGRLETDLAPVLDHAARGVQ